MKMEGMQDEELGGLFDRRDLRQRDKVGHLTESINNCEDDGVPP